MEAVILIIVCAFFGFVVIGALAAKGREIRVDE